MANEKRLIDANALDAILKDLESRYRKECFVLSAKAIANARQIVYAMKTVDAVEVVHGRWEFSHTTTVDKFAVVKCSNCGHEAFAIAKYVKYGHYCPNCGAKMDGDGNA